MTARRCYRESGEYALSLTFLEEPLFVLAEVRRILSPGGLFLLNDSIRQPVQPYLRDVWRGMQGEHGGGLQAGFCLFSSA